VTDGTAAERVVGTIVEPEGRIDAHVNNAGNHLRGFFEDLAEDEITRVFDTNLFGTMAVTRAVLPHMRARGRGRIVILTSIGGHLGAPGVSAYCSSKFALEGFGEALAQEVEPLGVQVTLVAPAMIETDIWGPNRGLARGSLNPESPYHQAFLAEERWADEWQRSSATRPWDVARAVHRALTIPRPRLRYVVGRRAGRVLTLRRLLPGELFERIYLALPARNTKSGAPRRPQSAWRGSPSGVAIRGHFPSGDRTAARARQPSPSSSARRGGLWLRKGSSAIRSCSSTMTMRGGRCLEGRRASPTGSL
jgi:NAD(P)-dependent dehydrogenase (short-subunit alcohol dehydrogenase family)